MPTVCLLHGRVVDFSHMPGLNRRPTVQCALWYLYRKFTKHYCHPYHGAVRWLDRIIVTRSELPEFWNFVHLVGCASLIVGFASTTQYTSRSRTGRILYRQSRVVTPRESNLRFTMGNRATHTMYRKSVGASDIRWWPAKSASGRKGKPMAHLLQPPWARLSAYSIILHITAVESSVWLT